jgi:hypothetical protein
VWREQRVGYGQGQLWSLFVDEECTCRLSAVDELQSSCEYRPAEAAADVGAGGDQIDSLANRRPLRVVPFDGATLTARRAGDGDGGALGVRVTETDVGIVEAILVVAVDGCHRVKN